jgi:hypothetical protein
MENPIFTEFLVQAKWLKDRGEAEAAGLSRAQ